MPANQFVQAGLQSFAAKAALEAPRFRYVVKRVARNHLVHEPEAFLLAAQRERAHDAESWLLRLPRLLFQDWFRANHDYSMSVKMSNRADKGRKVGNRLHLEGEVFRPFISPAQNCFALAPGNTWAALR